jgi:hypothetical protein
VCAVSVILLAALAAPADAQVPFGEVVVSAEPPQGNATHGYSEYRFQLVNRSNDRAYRVTLSLPHDSYASGRYGTYLRSARQTAEVGPAQTVTLALLAPARPGITGSGVTVFIDGEQQEDRLRLDFVNYHSRGMYGPGGGGGDALVLASRRALPVGGTPDKRALLAGSATIGLMQPGRQVWNGLVAVAVAEAVPKPDERFLSVLSGRSNVYSFPGRGFPIFRADAPPATWSTNWLSYSRYDGIVLTAEDLDDLVRAGAAGHAVRSALWQYVETGGSLTVFGPGPVSLPTGWKRFPERSGDWAIYRGGFGECVVTSDRNFADWHDDHWERVGEERAAARWTKLEESWRQTGSVWSGSHGLSELNRDFPVVDDLGVPVRSLFVLMILFSLGIGPVNLWLLSRARRKLWLLWTVPLISLCTCVAVFGYMVLAEGWQGHARVESVTLLDQSDAEPRASTLGRCALYSPITPGDGLRFSLATEITPLALDRHDGGSGPRTLEWAGDQHLARGWLTARVPAYFLLRKSEVRRERVTISKGPGGALTLLNALGADIRALWYADEKGRIYKSGPVSAGAQASLSATGSAVLPQPPNYREKFYRAVSTGLGLGKKLPPEEVLTRRTYLAELDSTPFLETGLRGARVRPSRSLVLGVLPEAE